MYRCLVILFYDVRDFLIDVITALKKLNCLVETYALYRYAADPYDRIPDYFDRMNHLTQEFNPDIVLFICLNLQTHELKLFRQHHIQRYLVLYSSHDPHSWFVPELELKQKAPYFDLVLTSCRECVDWYQQAGTKTAIFTTFGCQPKVRPSEPMTLDVTMCIMNLYDYLHDQLIPRRQFLDRITQSPNWSGSKPKYKFKLYGPTDFKSLYPAHYGGYVEMADLPKIFQTSRINLSLHTFGKYQGYLNSRCIQILAAGGLLAIDPVPGIGDLLIPDQECILLNPNDPINQLEHLLIDPQRLSMIALQGQRRAFKDYTWEQWSQHIWREFHRARFSATLYATFSGTLENYEHWDRVGRAQGHCGVVPLMNLDFDSRLYTQRYHIDPDQAWIHWLTVGRKSGFIYPARQHAASLTFVDLPFRDKIMLMAKIVSLSDPGSNHGAQLETILKLFQRLHQMYPQWNPTTLVQEYFRLAAIK